MHINSQLKDLSFLHFLVYLQHFHYSVLYPKHIYIYEKLLTAMSTNSFIHEVLFFLISFFLPIKKKPAMTTQNRKLYVHLDLCTLFRLQKIVIFKLSHLSTMYWVKFASVETSIHAKNHNCVLLVAKGNNVP